MLKVWHHISQFPFALKFVRCLSCIAAKAMAKYQSNMNILTPNLVSLKLYKILQSESYQILKQARRNLMTYPIIGINHDAFNIALMTLGCSHHAVLYSVWGKTSYHEGCLLLTHWGRDKMAAISQTTLSNAFSWMKILEFRWKFHWSLFLRVLLTIFQHWFW